MRKGEEEINGKNNKEKKDTGACICSSSTAHLLDDGLDGAQMAVVDRGEQVVLRLGRR